MGCVLLSVIFFLQNYTCYQIISLDNELSHLIYIISDGPQGPTLRTLITNYNFLMIGTSSGLRR